MEPHYHIWKHLKTDIYYCAHGECWKKVPIRQLHGKVAQCDKCAKIFVIEVGVNLPLNITCPLCSGEGHQLTLDMVERRLKNCSPNRVKEILTKPDEGLITSISNVLDSERDRLKRELTGSDDEEG